MNAPLHFSDSMSRHNSSASTLGVKTFVPPDYERRQRGHESGHVEQRSAVQVDVVCPDALKRAEERALGDKCPM